MNYTVDQIRDKRSLYRAKHDFDFGFKNEVIVMQGVYAWCFSRDIPCEYEKIDRNEKFADGQVHISPDYYVTINGKKKTYEIKCSTTNGFTKRNNKEFIFVKPHAIWSMIQHPDIYPNGKLLVATRSRFATLSAKEVNEYPVEEVDEWGGKKAFVLPAEEITWNSWLVPLQLS